MDEDVENHAKLVTLKSWIVSAGKSNKMESAWLVNTRNLSIPVSHAPYIREEEYLDFSSCFLR